MAEDIQDSQIFAVPEKEMRSILSGPAIFTNKTYVTSTPYGLKIAFCELSAGSHHPFFRQAVFMSWEDFASFMRILKRIEEDLQTIPMPTDAEGGSHGEE